MYVLIGLVSVLLIAFIVAWVLQLKNSKLQWSILIAWNAIALVLIAGMMFIGSDNHHKKTDNEILVEEFIIEFFESNGIDNIEEVRVVLTSEFHIPNGDDLSLVGSYRIIYGVDKEFTGEFDLRYKMGADGEYDVKINSFTHPHFE